MRVLVTGASGFIGSHVLAALLERGHEPVAFVRDATKMDAAIAMHGLNHDDIVIITGDVTDRASVRAALQGCDAVVHAVGIASLRAADPDQMMATNAGGTTNVIDEAVRQHLDPIVHVSSVVALFPPAGDMATSDDPVGTATTPYAASKARAERVAREAQARGAPVTIFYPGGVFGPRDLGRSDMIEGNATMLAKGAFILPRGCGNTFVDVRDLAQAIAASVQPGLGPRRFMAGGRWTEWAEWVGAFEVASGRKIRILETSPKTLIAMATVLDKAASLFSRFSPPIGREAAMFMSYAKPSDDARVRDELGIVWRPLGESVTDFVQWLVQDGCVTQPETPSSQPSKRDRIIARVVTSDAFRAVGRHVFPPMHRTMARLSGGKFVPGAGLILTTTGAKSGMERETPLEAVKRADGSYLVVGSNWAQDHHPAWTYNLIAAPEATILRKGRTIAVTATLLEGTAREAAWQEALDHWPAWRDYTSMTARDFCIFVLTPHRFDKPVRK